MFSDGKNCPRQDWTCRAYSIPRMALSHHLGAVTGISQFILDRHTATTAFAAVPITAVIHNFQTEVSANSHLPKRPAETCAFGFIGQLARAKGLGTLLGAFAKMADPRCELIVAGRGESEYEQSLRSQAEGQRIRFIGVARPEDFFPSIDVLVVPSLWHEPFGRVVVEAYSHGIPVLATERGGIPEIVDHLSTGILYDPDDPKALLRGLQLLAADPSLRTRLALNASHKAKEFLPNTICKQYDAVYSRVVG